MLRIYGRLRFYLLALGPGLVTAFADNDAGGITTYSLAGAQFGFGLMWVLLVAAIALTVTQETGARLALATGQGLAGLIRERFGVRWTAFAVLTMLVANLGTTVAEFAGMAAAFSLFGVPPGLSSILTASLVVLLLARGSFTRIQYGFVAIGAAVSALGPLVGPSARSVFAVGLFAAALLGLATVPLSSAYFACEAFGFERGLSFRWREAPVFYGLLSFFIAGAALFIVIPGLPLIQVMFLAQVVNGLLLPIILIFVMRLCREPNLGALRSGPILYPLGWAITALASAMSLTFVASLFL